ncbi:MAG: glycosyltransferase family 2 protein [Chitinophagales bacterium]|nr:glycosyltransferase family 2 protein [Chitinophagales bacterium]
MQNMPAISVVMSVYNDAEHVAATIGSILQQTFSDFELIVVDDCSTDNSLNIIQSFNDSRIILIENDKNFGLAASLNRGIHAANSKYIARIDSDDVALPERLKVQFDFMEQNPEVGVCGSYYQNFGYLTNISTVPLDDFSIKFKLLYDCPLLHPSLIIRKEVLDKNNMYYNPEFRKNQDYELYSRLVDVTRFANIPKVLMNYHQVESNLTRIQSGIQRDNILKIRRTFFSKVRVELSDIEIDLYANVNYHQYPTCKKDVVLLEQLFLRMIEGNLNSRYLPPEKFNAAIGMLWDNLCINNTHLGWWTFKVHRESKLRKYYASSIAESKKFLIKSIIRK